MFCEKERVADTQRKSEDYLNKVQEDLFQESGVFPSLGLRRFPQQGSEEPSQEGFREFSHQGSGGFPQQGSEEPSQERFREFSHQGSGGFPHQGSSGLPQSDPDLVQSTSDCVIDLEGIIPEYIYNKKTGDWDLNPAYPSPSMSSEASSTSFPQDKDLRTIFLEVLKKYHVALCIFLVSVVVGLIVYIALKKC